MAQRKSDWWSGVIGVVLSAAAAALVLESPAASLAGPPIIVQPAQTGAGALPPNAAVPTERIRPKIGVWLQVAGTSTTSNPATMNVNLQLSSTPQLGSFWQGYRARWVNPVLPDLAPGDVLLLHVSCGHVPGQVYRIQDFDLAGLLCPMLVAWADYRAAWTTLPAGIELVPYIGSPALVGTRSAGRAALERYLVPYDQMNMRVAFDASALMGGPDPEIRAAVLDYHHKHGVLLEPWINHNLIPLADDMGVVCWTSEVTRWHNQYNGGQPPWFPLELHRPVWYPIDEVPADWPQMNQNARNHWMATRAIGIALNGDVPIIPMGQAGCIKEFNAYFKGTR